MQEAGDWEEACMDSRQGGKVKLLMKGQRQVLEKQNKTNRKHQCSLLSGHTFLDQSYEWFQNSGKGRAAEHL